MSKKNNNTNRPTHIIWHVEGEGEKARWTRIGAAWMHKDSKGANLIFSLMPLGGRTLLREMTEQDDAQDVFNTEANGGAQ